MPTTPQTLVFRSLLYGDKSTWPKVGEECLLATEGLKLMTRRFRDEERFYFEPWFNRVAIITPVFEDAPKAEVETEPRKTPKFSNIPGKLADPDNTFRREDIY